MSSPEHCCGACHWSALRMVDDADDDVPILECHRRAPAVLVIAEDTYSMWPQVAADDWCGEFSP